MRLSWFFFTFLFASPLLALGQHSAPPEQVQPQVWPSKADEGKQVPTAPSPATSPVGDPKPAAGGIRLDVVVTDKAGNLVTGLTRSDFKLLDDDHPAQIRSFHAFGGTAPQPEVPTEIFLLIDTVNISFDEVSYSRFGIDKFLRNNGGKLPNPVSITWYTDTGLVAGGQPSTDGNKLAAELAATEGQLRTINRDAGVWGAIERFQMSVQTMNSIARGVSRVPGRKVLIWIGPGWPILDSPNLDLGWKEQQGLFHNIVDLSTLIRQGQMQLYSVTPGMPNVYTFLYQGYLKGVKNPQQANLPDLSYKVLAVQSGGLVLPPSNDLAREIARCAREAGAYYTLRFTPPAADRPNEYHTLKIVMDKPGLIARTSTGYYNQPPGTPRPR